MLHILHVEMVALVRDVLSKFMKPDAIPFDVDSLLDLDLHNRDLQHPDKLLSVGKFSHFAVNKARLEKKPWVPELYKALREGYTKAAGFLMKNLPLKNKDHHVFVCTFSFIAPASACAQCI